MTRASTFERLRNETAALGRKVAELQADLDGVVDSQQGIHAEIGNENIDRILERISAAGTTIPPNEFAEICTDYSAVRTSGGRGRVSVQLLSHLLSSPSSADVLSDPVVQPLMAHELYRQAAATRDLARGSLDQSLTAWKQISDNLPSPFNLACYARALDIKGDKRNAFRSFRRRRPLSAQRSARPRSRHVLCAAWRNRSRRQGARTDPACLSG